MSAPFSMSDEKRGSRSGTVVEIGPGPRQYAVRMDGSRNVSISNRKFLRTYKGVADLMADDVPQQHPHDEGGPADLASRKRKNMGNKRWLLSYVSPFSD